MAGRNHTVDPTWFHDAIAEFGFYYNWYVKAGEEVDEHYKQISTFDKKKIYGSLQNQGMKTIYSNNGVRQENQYKFYCSSMYRINIGDYISHADKHLKVDDVTEYDEYGVREATLSMIDISGYRDFDEYLRVLNGEEII